MYSPYTLDFRPEHAWTVSDARHVHPFARSHDGPVHGHALCTVPNALRTAIYALCTRFCPAGMAPAAFRSETSFAYPLPNLSLTLAYPLNSDRSTREGDIRVEMCEIRSTPPGDCAPRHGRCPDRIPGAPIWAARLLVIQIMPPKSAPRSASEPHESNVDTME